MKTTTSTEKYVLIGKGNGYDDVFYLFFNGEMEDVGNNKVMMSIADMDIVAERIDDVGERAITLPIFPKDTAEQLAEGFTIMLQGFIHKIYDKLTVELKNPDKITKNIAMLVQAGVTHVEAVPKNIAMRSIKNHD